AGIRSPTASRVRRRTSRACWPKRSSAATASAPAPREERDAAEDHRHAKPLPHRHAEREEAEEGVRLASELGKEAEATVSHEEHRRDLTGRPRLGREPPEEREQRDAFEPELVELGRMTRLGPAA